MQDDMDTIYTLMGACPQHDLLWEGLTGGPVLAPFPSDFPSMSSSSTQAASL